MIETNGRSTGFDYMRVILACAVIIWHAFGISYGINYTYDVENSPIRPLIMVILPMFFGLSGFLVAGSLYRNPNISTFLGMRAIRIFPALAVEVLLSAWILGPIITKSTIHNYFFSSMFLHYQYNMIGHIHYYLPGVFSNNPISSIVNGQLSTVPWELRCYIFLTIFAILGLTSRPKLFFGIVSVLTFFIFISNIRNSIIHGSPHSSVGGINLVLSFLSAVCIYKFKNSIPWSIGIATLSAIILVALFLVPGGDYLCGFPAAYLTIYLGLLNPKKIWFLRGADYSYGIYLYGFAIQQTVAQFGPWARHWYINLPISLFAACVFAALSWHLVEKPALSLKKYLPAFEEFWVRFRTLVWRPRIVKSENAVT